MRGNSKTFFQAASSILLLFISAQFLLSASVADATTVIQAPRSLITSGLVAWYTFDGKDIDWTTGQVTDRSGSGNVGQLNGLNLSTTSSVALGKTGQAFSFKPTTQRVETASDFVGSGAMSVSAWIYLNSYGGGTLGRIFDNTKALLLVVDELDEAALRWSSDNGITLIDSAVGSIPPNKWIHIAVTRSGAGLVNFYVNGVLSGAANQNGGTPAAGTTVTIGNRKADLARYFDGLVDDMRFYNRELSAAEIVRIYNLSQGSKITTTPTASANKNGLVAWYTFDGKDVNWATGQVVDRSGTGNTGQMTSLSTTSSITGGVMGQAMDFKTPVGYVRAAPATNINTLPTMTVCSWIKPRSYGGQGDGLFYGTFLDKSTNGINGGWNFCFESTTHGASFSVGHSISTVYRDTTQAIPLNQWSHVCATYDGGVLASGVHLFQNGIEITTSSGNAHDGSGTRSLDDANTLKVGNTADFTGFFDGAIDDARVYNRILSSSEIKQIYNSTAPAHVNVSLAGPANLSNGLVAWYTFDGKDMPAGKVLDRSGNGHHGSITLMSTSTMYVLGKLGQALRFPNETNAGVVMEPFTSMDSYTYAYWLYHDQELGWGTGVAVDTNTALYVIGSQQGSPQKLDYWYGGSDHISTGIVPANEWHHVAITATSGQTGTFYIDGVTSGTFASAPASGLIDQLGHTNATNEGLRGAMDDVRIYNRELSEAEILQLYKMGK